MSHGGPSPVLDSADLIFVDSVTRESWNGRDHVTVQGRVQGRQGNSCFASRSAVAPSCFERAWCRLPHFSILSPAVASWRAVSACFERARNRGQAPLRDGPRAPRRESGFSGNFERSPGASLVGTSRATRALAWPSRINDRI